MGKDSQTALPLVFEIESTTYSVGLGTYLRGKVRQGSLKLGEEILVLDSIPPRKYLIREIVIFNMTLESISSGDNARLLLDGYEREEIVPGSVAIKIGDLA